MLSEKDQALLAELIRLAQINTRAESGLRIEFSPRGDLAVSFDGLYHDLDKAVAILTKLAYWRPTRAQWENAWDSGDLAKTLKVGHEYNKWKEHAQQQLQADSTTP